MGYISRKFCFSNLSTCQVDKLAGVLIELKWCYNKFMTKKIVLKLKNIKYSGDSIGDDIRLEISILGKPFNIKKNIKVGTKQEFSKIVGEFDTDRKIFAYGSPFSGLHNGFRTRALG